MRSPWARPVPCRERAGKQARDAAHRADLWCSAARAVPPRALHPQDRSPEQQPGAPGWAQRDRSLRSNIRWWQATMAPPRPRRFHVSGLPVSLIILRIRY